MRPSITRLVPAFAFAVSAVALNACSAASDDDGEGTASQEKRVKPTGNEQYTTGTVVVKVPAGAPALVPTRVVFQKQGTSTAAEANLDTPTALPVGTYDLRVAGSNSATNYGSFTVTGGQTATVTLPVLAPVSLTQTPKTSVPAPAKFTYGPDYRPLYPEPARYTPALRLVGSGSVAGNPIGTNQGIVLVPNAKYEVVRQTPLGTYGVLSTLNVGATPQVHSLAGVSDLWSTVPFTVPSMNLEFEVDASDFAVAVYPRLTWACAARSDQTGNYQSYGDNGGALLATLTAAGVANQQTVKGSAGTPGCQYHLGLVSGAIALDMSKTTVTAAVHWIDVEDVHVTHSNGTVRDVKGKYRVSSVPGPGQPPRALTGFQYDTTTAVPVAAGTYLIEVQYQDNAGQKIYSETVTVP